MVEVIALSNDETTNVKMKLDNEQVLFHSNIGFKCDSRPPSENKEKPLDSTGLIGDGIVKENQNGFLHDIKGNDEDSDPSVYLENARDEWPASKLDYSSSVNDFTNNAEKVVRDVVTSNSHSSKNMNPFQDNFFYLDRSVMECDLPELVVCYKESTYHVVKDICIDEGVPTHDKFLFDSGMDGESDLSFLSSKKDRDSTLMKEKLDIDMSMEDVSMAPEENQSGKNVDNEYDSNKKLDLDTCVQNVSSFLEENDSKKGIPNQHDSKDLMLTRETKDNADGFELFTLGELLSMAKLSMVNSEAMSSNCRSDGIKLKSFQNSSEEEPMLTTPPLLSAVEEPNSSSREAILSAPVYISEVEESGSGKGETTKISPALASTSEESTRNSLVNEVSNNSKLETGNITVDFGSSALSGSKDECRNNLEHQPLETGSTPKLEDTADQPFSNNLQHGSGECSFSASGGPVTGLISYSGPIAHSGSLSLRSDSSTTSTRSFAFPILQSEWNSSPVRMAKPDRRRYWKHRGWVQGFLCCRF